MENPLDSDSHELILSTKGHRTNKAKEAKVARVIGKDNRNDKSLESELGGDRSYGGPTREGTEKFNRLPFCAIVSQFGRKKIGNIVKTNRNRERERLRRWLENNDW